MAFTEKNTPRRQLASLLKFQSPRLTSLLAFDLGQVHNVVTGALLFRFAFIFRYTSRRLALSLHKRPLGRGQNCSAICVTFSPTFEYYMNCFLYYSNSWSSNRSQCLCMMCQWINVTIDHLMPRSHGNASKSTKRGASWNERCTLVKSTGG